MEKYMPTPIINSTQSFIPKNKKTLHLKIAFIIIVTVFLPLILSTLISNPLFSTVLAVVMASLAILSMFMILKPLNEILKGTKNISLGNLNYRLDVRSNDELEDVGGAFNFLSETLKNAVENLENDKEVVSAERNQLSSILSSIIDGIIAIDGQRNIILINKAAEKMSGFNQSDLVGKPLDQFIHMFSETQEVDPKTYCSTSLILPLTMVGKNGSKAKVNLISSNVVEGIQTNLKCILILHDLTHEQELEQMKLDFVSMASHELKTPLTSIKGYLSVFISENNTKVPPQEMELLTRAMDATGQLYSLIENLLSVDKIEREQMAIRVESVDYKNTLQNAILDLQNQAKQKNITLSLQSQSDLPDVLADPIRIIEVINNLVSNAIHYTNSNGSITITTKLNSNEVITIVEDNGVGIPKEAIPHLFQKFFRVSSNLQAMEKGTGLGLYISKSIIEKLGGRIWVESEIGQGSKFYFSLQVAPTENLSNIDIQKFVGESIRHGGLNYY